MKPKFYTYIPVIVIIGFVLGVPWAILATVLLVIFHLAVNQENTLLWSILKRKSARRLIEQLAGKYNLNQAHYKHKAMKRALPMCIADALLAANTDQRKLAAFRAMEDCMKSVAAKHMMWEVKAEPVKSGTLGFSGRSNRVFALSAPQARVGLTYPFGFSIRTASHAFRIYPEFIIVESDDSFELVDWDEVTARVDSPVLIKERRAFSGNIRPSSVVYKYMNADGSPDIKHSYNPAYPVYRYYPLICAMGADCRFLTPYKEDASRMAGAIADYCRYFYAVPPRHSHAPAQKTNYNPDSIMNVLT